MRRSPSGLLLLAGFFRRRFGLFCRLFFCRLFFCDRGLLSGSLFYRHFFFGLFGLCFFFDSFRFLDRLRFLDSFRFLDRLRFLDSFRFLDRLRFLFDRFRRLFLGRLRGCYRLLRKLLLILLLGLGLLQPSLRDLCVELGDLHA